MILNSTECPKRRIDFTILSQNSGSMTGSCSFKCPNLKISLKKKMWNQRNKKWKKLRRCLQKKTLRTSTKSRERIKRVSKTLGVDLARYWRGPISPILHDDQLFERDECKRGLKRVWLKWDAASKTDFEDCQKLEVRCQVGGLLSKDE